MYLLILLFGLNAHAANKVCDVTVDGKFVGSYIAENCNQPWPDPGAVHTRNKIKEDDLALMDTRHKSKKTKKAAIKAQCASATGLLKDICEYL